MSQLVRSESLTVLSALEGTSATGTPANFGVQPTTGWRQTQPDPGGITGFFRADKKVARAPLSKNRQNEKGDPVDTDAKVSLKQSFNKDVVEFNAESVFVSKTKHTGGTGCAKFMVTPDGAGAIALSAVASGAYTVASLGTLPQGTLVWTRGFSQAANNCTTLPFVVAAASTGTSIKVASAVVEASPPANAMLEVCGFQFTSGDLQMSASGNLTTTTADFTTMGLLVGMVIWVGGDPGQAAFNFATAGYRGFAKINAIAAHQLTLERQQWVVGGADTGTGKTIEVLWGRWLRNVAIDNADYQETCQQLELSLPGAAAAGATAYKYAGGMYVNTWTVDAPLANLITSTHAYVGQLVTAPTVTRATGASTATTPTAQQGINTTSQLLKPAAIRDPNNGNAVICSNVVSWKLTANNNVMAEKQQGTFGAAFMSVGKFIAGVELEVYYVQTDTELAAADNRTCNFDVGLRNGDGGYFFDIPSFTITPGDIKTPANGPVTIAPKAEAFRDATYNFTLGMSIFPYLPAS